MSYIWLKLWYIDKCEDTVYLRVLCGWWKWLDWCESDKWHKINLSLDEESLRIHEVLVVY